MGKINYDEIINGYKDVTDINKIIEKYSKNPQMLEMELNKKQEIYEDFTKVPKSPIEIQNKVLRAEQNFYELSEEIRNCFDNDLEKFKTSIIDGTVAEKIKVNKEGNKTEKKEVGEKDE